MEKSAPKSVSGASAETAECCETNSQGCCTETAENAVTGNAVAGKVTAPEAEKNAVTYLLFTTKTCPNCRIAKEYLKNVAYRVVDAEEETDLTGQYHIMQAPTLVVQRGDQVERFANVSNIKRYLDSLELKG